MRRSDASLRWRYVSASDTALHPAFCRFVSTVFPRADFSRWIAWGLWDDRYRLLSAFAGDEMVANIGLQRMSLVLDGERVTATQWGAVGVVPGWRGCGLARSAVDRVLEAQGESLHFLYANPAVRAFYPRFGFVPRPSWRYRWPVRFTPANRIDALDPERAEVRAAFLEDAAGVGPLDERLSVLDFGRIAAWYFANRSSHRLFRFGDARWIVASQAQGVLRVEAVFAAGPVDWLTVLPSLLDAPIQMVEFGFRPAGLAASHAARIQAVEEAADLFVRGCGWPEDRSLCALART